MPWLLSPHPYDSQKRTVSQFPQLAERANRLTRKCRIYAPTEQLLKDRFSNVASLVKEWNLIMTDLPMAETLTDIMKEFDVALCVAALGDSKYLRKHISWNSGKALAVNGRTMTNRSGNYWNTPDPVSLSSRKRSSPIITSLFDERLV